MIHMRFQHNHYNYRNSESLSIVIIHIHSYHSPSSLSIMIFIYQHHPSYIIIIIHHHHHPLSFLCIIIFIHLDFYPSASSIISLFIFIIIDHHDSNNTLLPMNCTFSVHLAFPVFFFRAVNVKRNRSVSRKLKQRENARNKTRNNDSLKKGDKYCMLQNKQGRSGNTVGNGSSSYLARLMYMSAVYFYTYTEKNEQPVLA